MPGQLQREVSETKDSDHGNTGNTFVLVLNGGFSIIMCALFGAFHRRFPNLPQIACFDTAFHHDLPHVARLLANPYRYEALFARRYGFHGLSGACLMQELERLAGAKAVAIVCYQAKKLVGKFTEETEA